VLGSGLSSAGRTRRGSAWDTRRQLTSGHIKMTIGGDRRTDLGVDGFAQHRAETEVVGKLAPIGFAVYRSATMDQQTMALQTLLQRPKPL
jgi:hypothetical protein